MSNRARSVVFFAVCAWIISACDQDGPAAEGSPHPAAAGTNASSPDAMVVGSADAAAETGRGDADSPAADAQLSNDASPPDADQPDSMADAGANAALGFDPGDCAVRTVDSMDADTAIGMSLGLVLFSHGGITGGTLGFHEGSGSDPSAVAFTTLGTLQRDFVGFVNPIYELSPPPGSASCTSELRTTVTMRFWSEDSSLLDESWPVTVRVRDALLVAIEYEGAVAELSPAVRDRLQGDARTAGLDRVHFSFGLHEPGRAVLFERSTSPQEGVPWFDWTPSLSSDRVGLEILSCVAPARNGAVVCGSGSLQPPSSALTCVIDAITGGQPFLFRQTVTGSSTLDAHIGTLTPELAEGRSEFFWMTTESRNHRASELRRCASITVTPGSCDATVNALGCLACDSPGPELTFCSSLPE